MQEHEQLLYRYAGFLESHTEIAANLQDTLCFRCYSKGDRRRAHRLLLQRLQARSLTFRSIRILLYFELVYPLICALQPRHPAPRDS